MKKMKKVLSVMLVCAMMLTLLCVPSVYAVEPINESVSYSFDTDEGIPATIGMVGGGGSLSIENDSLKLITVPGNTPTVKIDISNWAGAVSKKGVLTYSFDYKADVENVSTNIMVGDVSTTTGHILAALQKTRLMGYDGTQTQAVNEWLSVDDTGAPHRVTLTFNFLEKTYSCSMGGKTVSHPFSYFADKTNNGKTYNCETANKFVLYLRTYCANDYSYYIDNFKAEYREYVTNVESVAYNFDADTTVPAEISTIGNSNGKINIEDNSLKLTTYAGKTADVKINISNWAGASSKKGILTYSFDYKTDVDGVSTHIMVGSNSTKEGHILATLQKKMLIGYGEANSANEWLSVDDTGAPHRVTLTFDLLEKTYSCSMGGKTVTHPFSYFADKTNNGVTFSCETADKFVLYLRTYCANGYNYYIDNFNAEYTEYTDYMDKYTVNEFAFDDAVVTAGSISTVNYNVVNNHRSNDKLLLISGVFEENLLLDCQIRILEFTASDYVADGSLSVNIPADADISKLNIKAFLWENETYKPITPYAYESANVNPTVHVVGDSIYADYTDDRYIQYVPDYGIGQALEAAGITVNNKAIPGASTNNWDGNMDRVLSEIEKGDYVLISFCHNDQKILTTAEYKTNISRIANEIKAQGGIPVFITSIPRYLWDDGELRITHTTENGNYIQTMIDAGTENNIPVINLNAHLRELFTAEGTNNTSYISFYSQAEGEALDTTHLSETGANYCANWLMGQFEALGFPFV